MSYTPWSHGQNCLNLLLFSEVRKTRDRFQRCSLSLSLFFSLLLPSFHLSLSIFSPFLLYFFVFFLFYLLPSFFPFSFFRSLFLFISFILSFYHCFFLLLSYFLPSFFLSCFPSFFFLFLWYPPSFFPTFFLPSLSFFLLYFWVFISLISPSTIRLQSTDSSQRLSNITSVFRCSLFSPHAKRWRS
jgi:hypothetical protein